MLQRDFVGIHSTQNTGWAVATKRLCWHPFHIEYWLSCCYKETLLAFIPHWTLVELLLERDFVGIHSALNTGWAVATKKLCWHPFCIKHWLSCCYKESLLAPFNIEHWLSGCYKETLLASILHWKLVELLLQREFVGIHSTLNTGWAVATKRLCWHPFYIEHWLSCCYKETLLASILHWTLVELLLQRDFVGIHSALNTGWAVATKRICWHHSTLNTGWAVAIKRLCWHPFYIEHWLSCCYKETLLASILHWTQVELLLQRDFVGTILHWTLVELLLHRDFVGIHSTLNTGWAVATKRLCRHPFYIEYWLSCCYKETMLASIPHWTLVELLVQRDFVGTILHWILVELLLQINFVGFHSTLNTGWAVATKRLCWHPFYTEHWLSSCYKETLLASILHWILVELLLQINFVGFHSTLNTGWAVTTKRLCWHPFYTEHWLSRC